jgi:RES domain-containing protein
LDKALPGLKLFRLCRSRTIAAAFDGTGARDYPGRWNLAGTPLVYAAGSRPLAILEVLVHTDSDLIPRQWLYEVEISEKVSLERWPANRLPPGWARVPPVLLTQEIGTRWVAEQRSCILQVPSVVSAGDFNYLLNPKHPDFSKLAISKPLPFRFDPRL